MKARAPMKRSPNCHGCQHLNLDADPPSCAKGHTLHLTSDLRCERGTRVEPASGLCLAKEWRRADA
jgi:hypothetical protein